MEMENKMSIEEKKKAIEQLPQYRGTVASKNTIRQLKNVSAGEIFWVELDNCPFVVSKIDKDKITVSALDENATISTGISIYEMNKAVVSKEKDFDFNDAEKVKVLRENIKNWLKDTCNEFYLLYCRELNYFTLFKWSGNNAVDIFFECLSPIGNMISMDFDTMEDQRSVEIWIRTADDVHLFYWIPFDQCVVEF